MQFGRNDTRAWDDKFASSDMGQQAIMLLAKQWAEMMERFLDPYPNMDMSAFRNMADMNLRGIWPCDDELQRKKILYAMLDVLVKYGWRPIALAGPFKEGLELDIRNWEADRIRHGLSVAQPFIPSTF